jgi:predicted ATPase/DNA-binding XRE family transcriptional regulator
MPFAISFGQSVKRRRKALDLTQTMLAQRVDCSVSAITKIEADQRRPSRTVVERLADALAIPPDERSAFMHLARTPDVSIDPAKPSTLPIPQTSFVGREQESAIVRALLRRPEVRLLTLTGTGGIGKTRLALHVAGDLSHDVAHGSHFVALAHLRDPDLLLSAIARTLGIADSGPQSPATTLTGYLQDKTLLLVLDNFEHLLPAAPQLSTLLDAVPNLKVLITSRTLLHISKEHEFSVPALALPNPRRLPPPYVLNETGAVALFMARAQDVQSEFRLNAANVAAVAALCICLDGLPLAIELAAARIRLFTPQALLARLQSPLDLLTGGSREAHPRQRTVRATIDWSYTLLTAAEQTLFARLAVFMGGSTVEAVEAICSTVGDRMGAILEGLAALLDQNLLQQDTGTDGTPRMTMLETLREYASECLLASGEREAVREQHCAYYLALVETAEPALRGPEQTMWLDRLEDDHANIQAAFSWAHAQSPAGVFLRLTAAFWRFWYIRGYLSEGRQWLAKALAHDTAAPAQVRAKALSGACALAASHGDHAEAYQFSEASLALWRACGDVRGMATALNNMGVYLSDQGEYSRSQGFLEESLALKRTIGDAWLIASTLGNLGEVVAYQGEYERARVLQEESLTLRRQIGDVRGVGLALLNLARIALIHQNYHTAMAALAEALAQLVPLGDTERIADCLDIVAMIHVAQGRAIPAARLFGSADVLRRQIHTEITFPYHADYARYLALAQAQLESTAWEAAWREGERCALEQIIGEALDFVAS